MMFRERANEALLYRRRTVNAAPMASLSDIPRRGEKKQSCQRTKGVLESLENDITRELGFGEEGENKDTACDAK